MTSNASDDFFEHSFRSEDTKFLDISLKSGHTQADVQKIRAIAKKGKDACLQQKVMLQHSAITDLRAEVRAASIDVLRILGEDAPMEIFLHALSDPDWDVRAAAAQALGLVGSRVPSKPLVDALICEEHAIVAEALIRTLGALKRETELIRFLLQHGKSWIIRSAAAWALGEQGECTPVQSLIDALSDSDEMVREAAARALGKVKSEEAVPALRRATRDNDEVVCEAARRALLQVFGQALASELPEKNIPSEE